MRASDPDLSGRELGRYRLVRPLGSGGMGVVYEAVHRQLGSRNAVKLLRRQHAKREVLRERFIREAQASAAINHPNIVAIHDFGESPEGWPYYVMEFLEGADLKAYLRMYGPWDWTQLTPLLEQGFDALIAAHHRGVIHRDIKPANCFVVGDVLRPHECQLKLLDFGIARLVWEPQQRLTLDGQVLGTPAYMAPEVALGEPADHRSDIYSLGVTVHKLLTGRFPGAEALEALYALPPGVRAALSAALVPDPARRFASMQAFRDALLEVPRAPGRFAGPGPRTRTAPHRQVEMLRQATPIAGTAAFEPHDDRPLPKTLFIEPSMRPVHVPNPSRPRRPRVALAVVVATVVILVLVAGVWGFLRGWAL